MCWLVSRDAEQKRNGLQGDWGYAMRHASAEEFIKALVRRDTHTAGEFLMSEDLTGDTEGETGGREGGSSRTEREEEQGENCSPWQDFTSWC